MVNKPDTNKARIRKHMRVRGKISGTYAQLIDDVKGVTLASASSLEKDFGEAKGNCEEARKVGKLIAERAAEKGITDVVFDRGGYIYHGRVKELAEGAREGGLKF